MYETDMSTATQTTTKTYRKLAMATAILEARALGALERGDHCGLNEAACALSRIRRGVK
jgi:hypothetical protein